MPTLPSIDLTCLTTDERRRAILLVLVHELWPYIEPDKALGIARWLRTGRLPTGDDRS